MDYKKIILMLSLLLTPTLARADLTIALIAPFSGSSASFGEQMRHGAAQAVHDINAKGGVLGEKIVLKEFDDACDPKQAVTAANQAISAGIKFVIGHYCSGAALAAANTYMENKVFIISHISHPDFTEKYGPLVFRINHRTEVQGQVLANYILKHFPGKKIVILHDKSSYGLELASTVKKQLNENGAQEIAFDAFTPGEKDYSALASSLKEKGADVVVIGGFHTEVGLITRQLREQKSFATVMGGMSLMSNELWGITGKEGEGILMAFGSDMRKRPEAMPAIEQIRQGGFEPEGFTLYDYAAVQVIAEGLEAAKKVDPLALATSLRQGEFSTVLGPLRFDAKGDMQNPKMVIYRWHDGSYAEVE